MVEAILNGVPLVVLPLFADQVPCFLLLPLHSQGSPCAQPDGAGLVKAAGNGLALDKFTLTKDDLGTALNRLLAQETFSATAKKLQAMLGPEPAKAALQRGLFWLKHLARNPKPWLRSRYEMGLWAQLESLNGVLACRAPVAGPGWLNAARLNCLDFVAAAVATIAVALYISRRLAKRNL